MKKILFSLVALVCSMSINAQVVKLMKGNTVVATFSASEVDNVVFEECNQVAVDLGLSVKWASCNIGASAPEEYGDYFAWGETIGYGQDTSDGRLFNWENYKWCSGSSNTLTKYNRYPQYGTVDNKTVLDPEDDAVRVNWGSTWRMPTKEEFDELCNNCTWTWTTLNGVNGYKVASTTNDNFIFLPAAGFRMDDNLSRAGTYGVYWSTSLYGVIGTARCLAFNWDGDWDEFRMGGSERRRGNSIRAVCP